MKTPRIVDALGQIDDALLTEAVTDRPKKTKIPAWAKWTAAAACICLCAVSVFTALRPGMGRTVFYHPVTQGDDLYYTDAHSNAYHWNPSMEEPESLGRTGRFYATEAGPVLYADQDQQLLLAEGDGLSLLGTAEVEGLLSDPELIGIQDDAVYWAGTPLKQAQENGGTCILKTALSDDTAQYLLSLEGGSLLTHTLRGDKLYYQMSCGNGTAEELRVLDTVTLQDTLLAELPVDPTSGMAARSYFGSEDIVLVDLYQPGLWTLPYEGGTPELLAQVAPYNHAMAEQDGVLYFATSFRKNEGSPLPGEPKEAEEAVISVDLDSGALHGIFGLEEGNGTVRYTVTELAMGAHGLYFADPQQGLYYHSFADGTDTRIQ